MAFTVSVHNYAGRNVIPDFSQLRREVEGKFFNCMRRDPAGIARRYHNTCAARHLFGNSFKALAGISDRFTLSRSPPRVVFFLTDIDNHCDRSGACWAESDLSKRKDAR